MKNCTYILRTVLICVFAIAGVLTGFSQQVEKGLNSSTGDYLGFLEYKPTDYSSNTTTKYPLIIFLHGIGERGNGTTMLQDVTCCGIPRIIRLGHKMKFTWNGKTETFLVISPQCPEKYGMWPAVFITELINYAKTNLRIDPNRIYLTGLSMGGGGTLRFISTAADQPKQLAAAATICAPCTFSNPIYPTDAKLPYWGFHAADDPTASVTCTEYAVKRMNDLYANPKPLLTIWPTGGHIVWDRVYTDTAYKYDGVVNMYEWFLAQNKTLPVNILPVARVGNTINITTGTAAATLNGSASTDADGSLVRYVWRKISGPTGGVITTPFGPNSSTTVTGLTTAGTYQYQLNVVDDRAAVSRDTLTVVVTSGTPVANIPPVAKAGTDANITLPTNTHTLNGSGSSDQDGTIATYLWTKVSGGAATIVNTGGVTTAVNGLVQGTYIFKLKVTDNKGAFSEDQVTIVVNAAPNAAPVAKAGTDVTITLPTNTVTLNGSGSTDSDGTIATYLWTKVSGGTATIASAGGSSTAINNLVEGTYVFKLKVTDNDGASSEDQVTVIVNAAPNAAPVAKAGTDVTITLPTNTVTLNGSGSTDSDGTIATYLWTKVSGGTATIASAGGSSTAINNLVEGTYVFKLKVTDNDGASSEDQVTVIVNAAPNAAPVAKAGTDVTITLPTNIVTLNGSGSTDSDGTIATYLWTKVSGGTATIASAGGSSTAINNLVEGTYVFKLKVTDNDGASSEDQVTVIVNAAPNAAPVAKAGTDVTITLPTNSVTLNGSGSTDSDGTIATYLWTKVSGGTATIASAGGSSTAINNLVEGTYVFKLKVTDNDGASSEDQVTVIVNAAPNVAPVAKAGTDVTITLPTNTVTLNGSGSTDIDGTIATYLWTKVSGPAATIASATGSSTAINNLLEGTYVFKLKVTDNDGASSEDQVTVIVNAAPNVAPVAKAGNDITITLPTNTVTLNGSGSTDSDGTIATYLWTKVSGPAATIASAAGSSTAINNLLEGTYVFKLKITDNDGASSEDQVTVIVNAAPNVAPVANAGNDITITLPTNTVTLNGSGSTDSDGTIATYLWTKVSGGTATIANTSGISTAVNNLTEGTYVFKLKVTDNDGSSSEDQVTVIVNSAPNGAPVANAGSDVTITLPTNTVTLNGNGSTDSDGTIATYLWTKVSGPAATIVNASGTSTAINNLIEGTYVFKLKVTDNDGSSSEDQVTVIVNAAPNGAPVANAGSDVTITLPTNTVTLNGSGSTDADGTIATYLWTKVSGGTATIANTSGTSTAVNNLTEGTYVFKLKVTDNDGSSSEDQVTVIVNAAPNGAPVANAGSDVTITLPTNTVTLNGSGSTDADGTIATYLWTKVSGGTATIANTSDTSTAVNNLTEGTYVFKLKVTDNDGSSSEDQVTVIVNAAPNGAPVANAGTDVTITLPTNTVTLNGSSSTDADGTIATYLWTKVSGGTVTIANTSGTSTVVNNLTEGTYVFKLKVTDNDGASAEDQVTVIVNAAPNGVPVANAGNDITITLPTNTATLNGSGSTDADGTIATYLWTKVSGPAATIANASGTSTGINNLVEGTYVFKLKVTDNDDASAEDEVTVIVNPAPNVAPIARAGADINITLPVNTVTLNGTNSTDNNGTISTYLWTKVSGPAATIANAGGSSTAINNLVEGTYIFKLRVTDNNGASAEDQVTVKVNPAANILPDAKAGNDITITLPDNRTTLSGITSSDADGSIVTYAWAKLSGPSQFIIGDATAALTSITNLVEGTYTFRLLVTDNKGGTDADTVVVKVNPAPPPPNVAPVAQAGENQTITLPDDNVILNGTASSDADGNITLFSWTFVSGPSTYTLGNETSSTANVTGMAAGTYSFRLQVTDNDGAVDADTITITVKEETAPPPPPNVAPVANAGNDFEITLPVNQVTLDGTASTDADGNITNYSWNKISGPSSFNIVNATSASTIIENLVEGTYVFQLLVKDNDGALSDDTVKILVHPAPNEVPASDAGPDMEFKLPAPNIQLNGTDSYDPDGTVSVYKWEQVSGPNTTTIDNTASATTAVTGVEEGVYVFRLTVTDNDGTKASDVVSITVLPADIPNVGPVADAGNDIEVTLPDATIQLNGSNSSDADGTITDYSWVKVSGPSVTITNSTGATPGIVGVVEGEYIFRLTVTDDDGEESSDEVRVIVHPAPVVPPPPANEIPVADAGDDQTISFPDSTSTISGNNSNDVDGTIANYEWTMVEGPAPATIVNPASPSTEINNLQAGDYIFVLTVVDNKGAVARDTVSISVINTQRFTEEFKVYPNPASSDINVQLTSDTLGTTRISIYNVSGMIVYSSDVEKASPMLLKNLNVSNLQTGVYYLEVIVEGKVRKITKFLKR